jgi:hypothetical protein
MNTTETRTAGRKACLQFTAPVILGRFRWLAARATAAQGTDRAILDAQATLASRYAVRACRFTPCPIVRLTAAGTLRNGVKLWMLAPKGWSSAG